jgi:hypothetical protein
MIIKKIKNSLKFLLFILSIFNSLVIVPVVKFSQQEQVDFDRLANTIVRMKPEIAAEKLFILPKEVRELILTQIKPARGAEIRNILLSMTEEDMCAICQDSLAVGELIPREVIACHAFHKDCINKWFERSSNCPMCRKEIASIVHRDSRASSVVVQEPMHSFDASMMALVPDIEAGEIIVQIERIIADDGALRSFLQDLDQHRTRVLIIAVLQERPVLFQRLIEHGINVDAQDRFGNTALIHAILNQDGAAVRRLLQANASLAIRNNDGFTPFEMAQRLRYLPGGSAVLGEIMASIGPCPFASRAEHRIL